MLLIENNLFLLVSHFNQETLAGVSSNGALNFITHLLSTCVVHFVASSYSTSITTSSAIQFNLNLLYSSGLVVVVNQSFMFQSPTRICNLNFT